MARPIKTNLDFEGIARNVNLPNPTSPQDAATKAYVDSAVEGLSWKDNARVATQANLNLAAPGATIDGVTMVAGDRVLVRAQTSQPENGIYVWNGAAVPATRSADANTEVELEQAICSVDEGTSANTAYRQTTINFTIGVGNVVWVTFGVAAPAASETTSGIAELATQAETNAGTDDLRIVTPLKLANFTGFTKKFASTFGDGAATQYDITHNFGTNDVEVAVYRVSDGVEILCDVKRQTTNAVRLNFASAPALNELRCVVVG